MTSFYKLSGAGNDFLALVEPPSLPTARQISAWCHRRHAVGGDGLFVLTRQPDGARMVHFNADGGRSDLCLNGSRCAVQLACHLGWAPRGRLTLSTDAGDLAARPVDPRQVELTLPPFIGPVEEKILKLGNDVYEGFLLSVGVPHFVLPWNASLAEVPITTMGPLLRGHPDLGPQGANVDFIRYIAADHIEMRSFERGVEGETLACGTGAVASVAAGLEAGQLRLPCRASTAGGFELTIGGSCEEGRLQRATLTGDARLVAEGNLLPGACAVPEDTVWSP